MTTHLADKRWMDLALNLGRRGWGQTWPNPAVGCVIVKDNRVIGRGWTQPGGRPHAETMALAQAGDQAAGATAFVTLEPCSHRGETPPCAAALIRAKIGRVVSALEDPDPRVMGQGHAMLRAAGIAVTTGCGAKQAAKDHAGFLLRVTKSRPLVTLKLASSFDGRIATASGESRWITGPKARRYVHYQRATHDAVLVGAGTMRADDPDLSVRDLGVGHQPVRVFVDSKLTVSPQCRLGQTAKHIPVWICHGPKAPEQARAAWLATGARLLACKTTKDQRLNIDDVLSRLADQGLTRIFCEGGGQLAASLLQAGAVDHLVGFTAGLALGAAGQPSVAALDAVPLAAHGRFTLSEVRALGDDILHRWHKEF